MINSNQAQSYGYIDPYAEDKASLFADRVKFAQNSKKFKQEQDFVHCVDFIESDSRFVDRSSKFDSVLKDIARRFRFVKFRSIVDYIAKNIPSELYYSAFCRLLNLTKKNDVETSEEKFKKWFESSLLKINERYKVRTAYIDRLLCRFDVSAVQANNDCKRANAKTCGVSLFSLNNDELENIAEMLESLFKRFEFNYQNNDGLLFEHYSSLNELVRYFGLSLPYAENFDGDMDSFNPKLALKDIARTQDVKFWKRRLNIQQRRAFENVAMANRMIDRYVSKNSLDFFLEQQKKNREFLKNSTASMVDNPNVRCTLLDIYDSSVSNPKNRVKELKVRAKGAELYANAHGYESIFVTATTPSRFHSNSEKYDGSSARDGADWLMTQWGRARALFSKHKLDYFGIRCTEPHKDGTPHSHFVIFIKPNQIDDFVKLMRKTWVECEPDGEKNGKWAKGRFNWKKIDSSKGSAVAYITKYVAKNVFSDDKVSKSDENESMSLSENSVNVRAWASLWNIRQFQFFGMPSVTTYRELRKIRSNESKEFVLPSSFKGVHSACDDGDFFQYIELQGKAYYKEQKRWNFGIYRDDEVKKNKYGEDVFVIRGVECAATKERIITRSDWELEKAKWDGESEFSADKFAGNQGFLGEEEKAGAKHTPLGLLKITVTNKNNYSEDRLKNSRNCNGVGIGMSFGREFMKRMTDYCKETFDDENY